MSVHGCVLAAGALAVALAAQTPPSPPAPVRFPVAPAVSPLGARNDLPNPYQPGVSWGQLPGGRTWGSTAGIALGRDGNIWALDRCGQSGAGGTTCAGSPLDPILQFDPSGRFIKGFGAGLFVSPHKITVDPEGNIWVADNGITEGKGQQVFKFSPEGKVLLTLGKAGVAGPGVDVFDQPTEVAIAPNGDIFVADGHGNMPTANARIVKFDRTGRFIKTWGRKGTAAGDFDCPHTLAFDSQGRLFVGDRQNNRIQIFDQNGRLHRGVEAVRAAERPLHRPERRPVCRRLRVEGRRGRLRLQPRRAPRHPDRQRPGRLGPVPSFPIPPRIRRPPGRPRPKA